MTFWQTVTLAITGNAIALAVLGFLAKSLVNGLLRKDLEKFKSSLVAETESTVEKLRYQLGLLAMEHQVKFSKLHEDRAEVIAELYSRLVEAHWAGEGFVSPMEYVGEPSKEEKFKKALNASASFYQYFEKKKIYLPKALCDQLDSFVKTIREQSVNFGVYLMHPPEHLPPNVEKEKTEAWHKAWKTFEEKVPKAREALEDELRAILGHTALTEEINKSLKADAVTGAA